MTGRILFFSTLGSFLGAVFSTLVLMANIGVHYTVALNFFILAGLVIILSKKKMGEKPLIAVGIALSALYINSGDMMKMFSIVENNQYNTIMFVEDAENGDRHLVMNNNASSMYNDAGGEA